MRHERSLSRAALVYLQMKQLPRTPFWGGRAGCRLNGGHCTRDAADIPCKQGHEHSEPDEAFFPCLDQAVALRRSRIRHSMAALGDSVQYPGGVEWPGS